LARNYGITYTTTTTRVISALIADILLSDTTVETSEVATVSIDGCIGGCGEETGVTAIIHHTCTILIDVGRVTIFTVGLIMASCAVIY
jgi:hypothetical protein